MLFLGKLNSLRCFWESSISGIPRRWPPSSYRHPPRPSPTFLPLEEQPQRAQWCSCQPPIPKQTGVSASHSCHIFSMGVLGGCVISPAVSLKEVPGDREVICTGRQAVGMCTAWFVPLARFDLGPGWLHPTLGPVSYVLERQFPCGWWGQRRGSG